MTIITHPLFTSEHMQLSFPAGQNEIEEVWKNNAGAAMYLKMYQQFQNS